MDTRSPSSPARPPQAALLDAGDRFGKYEIVRLIGAGGMGAVYEAQHLELRRRVAIKVLLPEIAADREARRRFLREGEAAARIRHPNVITVLDVDSAGDMPFLVMEFLEGESLSAAIERRGVFALEEALEIMLPVMAAVQAGHDAGVIHRDLKPQNIFLERAAGGLIQPKVLDFGVSKITADVHSTRLTGQASILGTAAYMSPEQACGSATVTEASDEYSLVLILIELLTGRCLHAGENPLAVLASVIQNRIPDLDALLPQYSPEIRAICRRSLSTASERFRTVKELGAALLPYAGPKAQAIWADVFLAGVRPTLTTSVSESKRGTAVLPVGSVSASVKPASESVVTEAVTRSRSRWWLLGGLAVLAVASLVVALRWRAAPAQDAALAPSPAREAIVVPQGPPVAPASPPKPSVVEPEPAQERADERARPDADSPNRRTRGNPVPKPIPRPSTPAPRTGANDSPILR